MHYECTIEIVKVLTLGWYYLPTQTTLIAMYIHVLKPLITQLSPDSAHIWYID